MADASYSVNLSFTSFAKARPFGVMEISAEPIRAPRSPDPDERSRPFSRCAQSTTGVCRKRRRTGPSSGAYRARTRSSMRATSSTPATSRRRVSRSVSRNRSCGRPRGVVDLDHQAAVDQRRRAARGPRSAVRPPPPSGRTRRRGCGRSSPATSGRPRRRCRAAAAGRARSSRSAPGRSGHRRSPLPAARPLALRCHPVSLPCSTWIVRSTAAPAGSGPAVVSSTWPGGRWRRRAALRAGSSSENTSSSTSTGGSSDALGHQPVRGQAQRERQGPLLALRRVGAGRQPVQAQLEVVAVRPDQAHLAPHLVGLRRGERLGQPGRPPGRLVAHLAPPPPSHRRPGRRRPGRPGDRARRPARRGRDRCARRPRPASRSRRRA